MKLSIIIPSYNEENNIKKMYKTIVETFINEKFKLELIFINDGSSDKTLEELKKILNTSKNEIKIIDFSRNFGKESAIYAGLKEASGDYISIIDSDLQQHPKYILQMIKILQNNPEYDCVTAYQEERKENIIIRCLKKTFYKTINLISEVNFVNAASDFRTFNRNVANALLEITEYNRFSKGIFSWIGFKTYYMPYKVLKRNSGKSKWSLKKLFKYAFNGILNYSFMPIKTIKYIGFIYLLGFIFYCIFTINNFNYTKCILAFILLSLGLIFMSIYIVAEYVAKIFSESKKRPIYISKKIYTNNKK